MTQTPYSPPRWILYLVTIAAVFCFCVKWYYLTLNNFFWPGIGFNYEFNNQTGYVKLTQVYQDRPAAQAGLAKDDVVCRSDGSPFQSTREFRALIREAFVTQQVTFHVRTAEGQVVAHPVRVKVGFRPPSSFYQVYFLTLFFIITLLCLSLGLMILWLRWGNSTSRLGGLFFVAMALFFQNPNASLMPVGIRWLYEGYQHFIFFAGYLCFSFFSEFPAPNAFAGRLRWVRRLYFSVLAYIALPVMLVYSYSDEWNPKLTDLISRLTFGRIDQTLSLLLFVGFVACLTFGLPGIRSTIEVHQERRFRVMMTGMLIGVGPIMALTLISFVLRGNTNVDALFPVWVLAIASLLYVVFPLTFAYTVITERVLGVQQLLRKSVQYAFFSRGYLVVEGIVLYSVLKMIVWLVALEAQAFFQTQLSPPVLNTVFYMCGAVGLFFFWRINPRLQTEIDRRFFRDAYQAHQVLSQLSRNVRNMTRSDEVLQQVAETIKTALHINQVTFLIQAPILSTGGESAGSTEFRGFVCRFDVSPKCSLEPNVVLPGSAYVVQAMNEENGPVDVFLEEPEAWTDALVLREKTTTPEARSEYAVLKELETNLLIPLATDNTLLGILSLGPKLSEEPFTSEDKNLLSAVAEATSLRIENSQLIKRVMEEATLRREIEIAKTMQQSLLPAAPPELPGFEIAGYSVAANDVGGDYFDYFLLNDSQLAVAVGDVTGHGVSSGLLMACAKGGLLTLVGVDPAPKAVMYGLNNLICRTGNKRNLMTFAYGVVDAGNRTLELANAGHPFPYHYKAASGTVEPLEISAYPLGVRRNTNYETLLVSLQPGDAVVFYSDGIPEAKNTNDQELGFDGLENIIAAHGEGTAGALRDAILEATRTFVQGLPMEDDVTLVVIRATV
ncbi:MAG: SpoIIE family protein phosphatase [Blastocatellia bacterium]|nr:SpoIIE family protein phosphatase [Blastocatellia bacterium]